MIYFTLYDKPYSLVLVTIRVSSITVTIRLLLTTTLLMLLGLLLLKVRVHIRVGIGEALSSRRHHIWRHHIRGRPAVLMRWLMWRVHIRAVRRGRVIARWIGPEPDARIAAIQILHRIRQHPGAIHRVRVYGQTKRLHRLGHIASTHESPGSGFGSASRCDLALDFAIFYRFVVACRSGSAFPASTATNCF
jgi:hypothetical protein